MASDDLLRDVSWAEVEAAVAAARRNRAERVGTGVRSMTAGVGRAREKGQRSLSRPAVAAALVAVIGIAWIGVALIEI